MQKEAVLVSACLLGIPCRYDGKSMPREGVWDLAKHFRLIPICPEVMGGLPIPREPMEIRDGHVMSRTGKDGTSAYRKGAETALTLANRYGCRAALLKENSPSCGKGMIHNGKFDGGLIPGSGIAAGLLTANGIAVFGESKIGELIAFLEQKS